MAIKRAPKALYVTLILILGIVCVLGILWFVPKWQVDKYISSKDFKKLKEPIELENDTRRTWAQILGGAFFLITAYFTWRNLHIAKEGQITERFTKAIDQLGNEDHLEVRLGGIYALERIARDSKKDHWTIMEVLSSYVRVNAPRRGKAEQAKEKGKSEGKKSRRFPESSQTLIDISIPPTDIQAILTAIGRRILSHEKGEKRHIDLHKTYLRNMNLSNANFDNAYFCKADLQDANLQDANLNLADLQDADLQRAYLGGAYLNKADLRWANLSKADLMEADLRGADLLLANLSKADLKDADLRGADLMEADLRGAFLTDANLSEACLWGVDLSKADLKDADLRGAYLRGADLRGADDLTIKQLSKVKTLYEAKLDSELMEQIEKKYPHLLEVPKEEEEKKEKE